MKTSPLTAVRLPVCLLLGAACALTLAGCANMAKNFAEGWKNSGSLEAAREHRGTAFKPTYGPGGAYTGYTQEVGDTIYMHAPNGRIIGSYKPRPPIEWVLYHDEHGRLVKKTLGRYSLEDTKDLTVYPNVTLVYHYNEGGELLGTTTLMHEEGYDRAVHNDEFGRAFAPYVTPPWVQTAH